MFQSKVVTENIYDLEGRQSMNELREIMEKFTLSGWELICGPAQQWLDGEIDNGTIIPVIQEADKQCGSCGCEFDPLYKRALELL